MNASTYTDETLPPPVFRRGCCPKCKGDLKRVWSAKKEKHYWFCQSAGEVCGAIYSDHDGEPQTQQIAKEPVPDLECPSCGAGMQLVEGARFGSFLGCSDRSCGCTIDLRDQSLPPSLDNLPPCCPTDETHGYMRRRNGRNGPFFGCREYPLCRATRPMDEAVEKRK